MAEICNTFLIMVVYNNDIYYYMWIITTFITTFIKNTLSGWIWKMLKRIYLPLMWYHFRRGCWLKVLSICYLDKGYGPLFAFHRSRKRCNILRKYKQYLLSRIDKIRHRFVQMAQKKLSFREQKLCIYYWEKLFVWKIPVASFRGCNRESLSIIFLRQKAARNTSFHMSVT